jgi:hypothetical protein
MTGKVHQATGRPAPIPWKCPGCGAIVDVPMGRSENDGCTVPSVPGRRMDQLAQAVCACWAKTLSLDELTTLVGAVMGDGHGRSRGLGG